VRTYALEHMDAPAFRELTHYALDNYGVLAILQ
jgi:hypothetical protein